MKMYSWQKVKKNCCLEASAVVFICLGKFSFSFTKTVMPHTVHLILYWMLGAKHKTLHDVLIFISSFHRHKAITEIRKLRRQLTNEINLIIPSCNLILDPKMPPPTDDQVCVCVKLMSEYEWTQLNLLSSDSMAQMLKFPYIFQARLLRQIVLSGSIDHVARRVDDCELKTPEDKAKWRHAYRYSIDV